MAQNYSPEKIDQLLSDNFDGDLVEKYNNYDGSNDPDVDLFEGNSFLKMNQSTKRFSINISNTDAVGKTIALTPGFFSTLRATPVVAGANAGAPNRYLLPDGTYVNTTLPIGAIVIDYKSKADIEAAGIIVDAVLDDGSLIGKLLAQSTESERSIRNFLRDIEKNPVMFAGIQITSDNVQLFDSVLKLRTVSPYQAPMEKIIPFGDFFRSQDPNNKKIFVEKEFKFDNNTVAILNVPGNTNATLTFIAGAVVNMGNALNTKAQAAKTGSSIRQIKIKK